MAHKARLEGEVRLFIDILERSDAVQVQLEKKQCPKARFKKKKCACEQKKVMKERLRLKGIERCVNRSARAARKLRWRSSV